jgi:hypothetical protein
MPVNTSMAILLHLEQIGGFKNDNASVSLRRHATDNLHISPFS